MIRYIDTEPECPRKRSKECLNHIPQHQPNFFAISPPSLGFEVSPPFLAPRSSSDHGSRSATDSQHAARPCLDVLEDTKSLGQAICSVLGLFRCVKNARALCNRDGGRVQGTASKRAREIGFEQTSQTPKVPCLIRARACSIARRRRASV